MDVFLITGFLGAGKTTLIRHLLSSEFNAEARVAVIVNEVGEIGIDGSVIDRQDGQDVDVMELTSEDMREELGISTLRVRKALTHAIRAHRAAV